MATGQIILTPPCISPTCRYLTDMWAYSLTHQSWIKVESAWVGADSGFPQQLWPPAAAFDGHRMYVMATGSEGDPALYRWVPVFVPTSPPQPGPSGSQGGSSSDGGLRAGVVFAALFSAFNAAVLGTFLFQSWRARRSRLYLRAADAGLLYDHVHQADPLQQHF